MSDHDWFREHLTLYAADGLDADDSLRFERHAAECAACAQELARWRLFDQGLDRLCAPVHFAADWDQRVLSQMRAGGFSPPDAKPPRRWSWPARWAMAAAAMLFIGVLGAAVNTVAQAGFLAFPGGDTVQADAGLPAVVPVLRMQSSNNLKQLGVSLGEHDGETTYQIEGHVHHGANVNGRTPEANQPVGGDFESFGRVNRDLGSGLTAVGTLTAEAKTSAAGGIIGGKQSKEIDFAQIGIGTGTMASFDRAFRNWHYVPQTSGGEKVPDGGNVLLGGLEKRLDDLQDYPDVLAAVKETHTGSLMFGMGAQPPDKAASIDAKLGRKGDLDGKRVEDQAAMRTPATEYYNPPALANTKAGGAIDGAPERGFSAGRSGLSKETSAAGGGAPKDQKRVVEKATPSTPNIDKANEPIAAQIKPDQQAAGRKIIRTGDLDFEVENFDNTVSQISKLIGAIPNAFVLTINSDKLENGKVKGSVVVRVPPEHLDKFVLDLRKIGELKSQRIGSQDVSKQYTDIESALRAARAMEERFLNIIKTGKGEIKDLIAAEQALGAERAKIEKMEGEIRYYNNQIALSTLTITAYEKEIRAAASVVVSEQVTMKIEADDVEKALQTAIAAVTDAKGRITKSDLKQLAAGQLEATLLFEVAPAAANAVKEKLRALGVVTNQDSQRTQQAEGGTEPGGLAPRTRTNDVHFSVTLYNVANIQPREAFVIQFAVSDVPADYAKLLELVNQTKSQVRKSELNEQEKLNVNAQLDFDVPADRRDAIEKLLADLGEVMSRNTTRAGPGETATDRKVGYRISLKSINSIPPRETVGFAIEVKNVEKSAAEFVAIAQRVKGRVVESKLTQDAAGRAIGTQVFDVPLAAKEEVVRAIKDAGQVRGQDSAQNLQAPEGKLATARIGVRLLNPNPIVPLDEGVWPQIRTSLAYAFRLLSVSLMFVIVGLSVILPWALVIWVAVKLVRRARSKTV